jgi:hypothetical protein
MPFIDWKKLKERVSLRDILDHYQLTGGLKETPQGLEGDCPLCGSHAFKVNREKNAWFCFGECKTKAEETETHNGGNILDLVSRLEGVSVKRAAELITEWFPDDGRAPQPKKARTGEPKKEPKKAEAPQAPEHTREQAPPEHEETDAAVGKGEEVRGTSARPDEPPEILTGRTNRPLPFVLKSIDVDHPELDRLGFEPGTLRHFGVGYFTGKGMMHEKVVLPFHHKEGPLVAYVGYSIKDSTFLYPEPKDFDRRLELYNYPRCEIGFRLNDSVVLVTDLFNVLRLYEYGVRNVMALPTDKIYEPQLDLIESLVGIGGRVDFVPWTLEYRENLDKLAARFYVRLHRYYNGSEDEFLRQVVQKWDW